MLPFSARVMGSQGYNLETRNEAMSERPDYDGIKRMGKETGKSVRELLALEPKSDPFYSGMPSSTAEAKWFVRLWRRYDFQGAHLRRMHYKLVSQKPGTIKLPPVKKVVSAKGEKKRYSDTEVAEPYENTEECWQKLGLCSKHARHLGLVEAHLFHDARTPDPTLAWYRDGDAPEPEANLREFPDWGFPSVIMSDCARLELPDVEVKGYEYDQADQPYHLELWIEKSTMDDILVPLCRRLGVNFVPGVGFASIRSTIKTLQRIDDLPAGKPTRIFCVVDFDPAGDHMPTALARQVEFYLARYAPGREVKVTVIALTREQVIGYDLPRVPVKESDVRKKGWEDRRGEGAVELDALEALHPGELAKLVEEAVRPYRDDDLETRMENAHKDAQTQLRQRWEAATQAAREDLEEIRAEAQGVVDSYRDRVENLDGELQAELEPLYERLAATRKAVEAAWDGLEVNLPERPAPETEEVDESDRLFDSERTYLEQIAAYRRAKGGEEE
jgi:hypothetical protein